MILKEAHSPTVSASEITTWKTCRQKWYWSYVRKIEPRQLVAPVRVGILGHIGIAEWLQGRSPRVAIEEHVRRNADGRFAEETVDMEAEAELAASVVERFVATQAPRRLLHSEMDFTVPIARMHKRSYQGFVDALTEDENGDVWIEEFKFVKAFRAEEEVELSTQLGIYHLAMLQLGYNVLGIRFHQILQKLPSKPSLNKNGSMSRQDILCTWEDYEHALIEAGLPPEHYFDDMFPKLGGKAFSKTFTLIRSREHVLKMRDELLAVSRDIFNPQKHIYMCDSTLTCRQCSFRDLCLETLRGRDPESLIESAYQPRTRRVEVLETEEPE